MLTITNKQMEVFEAYLMDSFINNTRNHLRHKFPVSTKHLTDKTLNDLITEGIEKAAHYDIVEREDVIPFIEYMVWLGKDFDKEEKNKWAVEILTMEDVEGIDKIALLSSKNPLYPELEYGQNQSK